MSALFNSVMGQLNSSNAALPLPDQTNVGATGASAMASSPSAAMYPNPVAAQMAPPNAMEAYMNQLRQNAATTQALGGRTSPFQNALNAYNQVSSNPVSPAILSPVRSPETATMAPPPGQMPAPSPLLQGGGGGKDRLMMVLKMLSGGGA